MKKYLFLIVLLVYAFVGSADIEDTKEFQLLPDTIQKAYLEVKKTRYTAPYVNSIASIQALVNWAETRENEFFRMITYKTKADILEHHGKIDSSIALQQRSLEIARTIKDTSQILLIQGDLAYIYFLLDKPAKALSYLLPSIELARKNDRSEALVIMLYQLVDYYLSTGQTTEAERMMEEVFELGVKSKNIYHQHHAYRYRGEFLRQNQKAKLALNDFNQAERLAIKMKDSIAIGDTWFMQAKALADLDKTQEAINLLIKLKGLWIRKSKTWSLPGVLIELSTLYLKVNELQKSEAALEEVKGLNIKRNVLGNELKYYRLHAQIEGAKGNENKAKEYQILALKKELELKEIQTEQQLIDLEYKYRSEEKARMLAISKEKLAQQSERFRLQRAFIGVMSIALVIAIIFFIVGRSQYIKLNQQREALQQQNKEKDLLFKEVHHRVKNNLQLISGMLGLQKSQTESEIIKQAISDGQLRVKTMALIHQALYMNDDLDQVNLQEFVTSLLDQLQRLFSNELNKKSILVTSECEHIKVGINHAIPLGLIINEMVTNSFKHAFSEQDRGEVFIRASVIEDLLSLEIGDTGKGLNLDEINKLNLKSLGFKLMNMLLEQIEAHYRFESKRGFVLNLSFSLTEQKL